MFAVPRKEMPESKTRRQEPVNGDEPAEEEEVLLGFARLYSGVLKVNTRIAALLPKYDIQRAPDHKRNKNFIQSLSIQGLYTMMGRELVPVEQVTAGNVFAISGLAGFVGRAATLCAPNSRGYPEDEAIGDESKEWFVNLGAINLQVCNSVFSYFPLRRYLRWHLLSE